MASVAATAATSATSQALESSRKTLASNFDTFLTLLTAQLKNQDPLSPMDTNQFTQQLVQYSGVEQQIRGNDLLNKIVGQNTSSSSALAVSYLGKNATAKNDTAIMKNGQVDWKFNLPQTAASSTITIFDSNNVLVASSVGPTGSGDKTFNWNGKNSRGIQLPDGNYKIKVDALDAGGQKFTGTTYSTGVISQVDMSGENPTVTINGVTVALSNVTKVNL